MKRLLLPTFLVLASLAQAQPSRLIELLPPRILERGPHHRIIEQTQCYVTPSGQVIERIGSYTEIGTGMNFFDPQENLWKESRPTLEVFEGYCAARQGQIQATFQANLNTAGASSGSPFGTTNNKMCQPIPKTFSLRIDFALHCLAGRAMLRFKILWRVYDYIFWQTAPCETN